MVDLTTALESLFGPEDNQELSHRISLRAAWLLGRDLVGDDPSPSSAEVYERVRTMYKVRSARVHSDIPKVKDIHKWVTVLSGVRHDPSQHGGVLDKAMESARAIVRQAIRAGARLAEIDPSWPHWPLPEDFNILSVPSLQRRKCQRAAG